MEGEPLAIPEVTSRPKGSKPKTSLNHKDATRIGLNQGGLITRTIPLNQQTRKTSTSKEEFRIKQQ